MVDFALRSAPKTIGQPSTSEQPSTSGQPSAEEELPEYSQSGYARTNISLPISEINKIIKNKPELKKEIKKNLASALLNEEIDEDEYDEALKDIPTLKQQTEEIIMKNPTIKHDISRVAEQKALNKLMKGEITSKEYNDIKTYIMNPLKHQITLLENQ